jgi:hypothetical protein
MNAIQPWNDRLGPPPAGSMVPIKGVSEPIRNRSTNAPVTAGRRRWLRSTAFSGFHSRYGILHVTVPLPLS